MATTTLCFILALTLGLAATAPVIAQDASPGQIESAAPVGAWMLRAMGREQVDTQVETTLVVTPGGRASGMAGCNRYNAAAMIDGGLIHFGDVTSTRMACAEPAMQQEARFLSALSDVTAWRIREDSQLELLDAGGTPVLVLSRGQSA